MGAVCPYIKTLRVQYVPKKLLIDKNKFCKKFIKIIAFEAGWIKKHIPAEKF